MNKKTLATMALMLLAVTMLTSVLIQQTPLSIAQASEGNISTNAEYSNGTLGTINPELTLWYDWVNTSGSQVIFLAYQSHSTNPPVIKFLGQHYYSGNGTEVFVGNTLEAMEVYNDTNGNGLPDANYTSGRSEILYDFFVNSSASVDIHPINKTVIDGVPHYQWGVRYWSVDGFFISPENLSTISSVMIDYMDFSYNFYVQNNVTYTKTNFGLGRILQMMPYPGRNNISLNGLSLALFYGTIVIASKPYVTMVNGNLYNSTTAPASVEPTNSSEIKIAEATAYKFLFGQNYTLFRDSTPEIYESKCTAVSNQSVAEGIGHSMWVLSLFEDTLTSIFPTISMQAAINLDYNASSLLYRVCYPQWSGYALQHDPTYVAYLGVPTIPELSPPVMFVVVAAVASSIALVAALIDFKKTRKTLRQLTPPVSLPL